LEFLGSKQQTPSAAAAANRDQSTIHYGLANRTGGSVAEVFSSLTSR
jgi:hypothetical protein